MQTNQQKLALRYNWQLRCFQVWNYAKGSTQGWRWFSITDEMAKRYMDALVPVAIEETVAS